MRRVLPRFSPPSVGVVGLLCFTLLLTPLQVAVSEDLEVVFNNVRRSLPEKELERALATPPPLLRGSSDRGPTVYRQRVTVRGKGSDVWGWGTAYGRPDTPKPVATPGAKS